MANIAKITLPSGDEYDLKDAFVREKTIEYIVGTQTAKTGSWTGVTTDSVLYTGKTIAYKLPYAGSGNASLTLTLADGTNTAAVPVYANTTRVTTHYGAGSVIVMTYDGTNWRTTEYWVSNTNTVPSAYGEVAAATAGKTASCSNFTLTANTYLHFDLRYANSVQGAITMNVNGTGGKPIYINGEASSATNYTLPAGSYIAFYDGTAWQFRTDGKLPGVGIIGDAGTVNSHTVESDVPQNAVFTDTTYTASSSNPIMDGTASPGSSSDYARGDHVHPTDTSRAPLASPALTGTPTAPTATAGTNTTQVATTAFVKTAVDDAVGATLSITIPVSAWSNREATVTCQGVTTTSNILVTSDPSTMEAATASGVYCSAQGTNTLTFTCMGEEPEEDLIMDIWIGRFLVDSASYAPISSPTFTGTPTAPTAAAGTSSTQIATTAFVMSAIGSSGLTPSSTDPLMDGTATSGTSVEYARGDHVHPTDTSRAAASHTHGNITNDGKITASGVAIAANDTLVIVDASDSSKLKQTSIKFDGSTTTKALTPKGTFETFITSHQSLDAYATKASPAFTGTPTAPTATAGTSTTQIATTEFVANAISSVAGAMYFMGSLGTGGTITTLPAASASNKGYAYKVITAGTYQSVAAKVGDMLVSDGTAWVLIPSGDEPSGTVTSITLKAGIGISLDVDDTAITTSGTRTITNSGVRSIATGSTNGTISVNTGGTSAEVSVAGLGSAAYTASGDYATSGHVHGSITNAGAITGTTALANGDGLIFADSSDSSKLKRSTITIGTGTTTYLRNDGTWGTPVGTTYTPATSVTAVGTTAVTGTSTNYARQDHVHNIVLATGDSNGQVKIAGTNVSVKGLGTMAYAATGDYVAKAGDTMTGDLTLPNMTATGTVKVGNSVTLSYNSTTQALDFIFD